MDSKSVGKHDFTWIKLDDDLPGLYSTQGLYKQDFVVSLGDANSIKAEFEKNLGRYIAPTKAIDASKSG